jgi:hypothetical protein
MEEASCRFMAFTVLFVFLAVWPASAAESAKATAALPKKAVLKETFSIASFGGDTLQLADLDGDGQLDLLVLQSAGQFCSKIYGKRDDLDEVDRTLYCLTAVNLKGKVLWQDGTPYSRDFPFTSHGAQGGGLMLCVDDLDADGKPEVVVMRHGELAILDAATGKKKASVELPADNFVDIATAQFGPPEKGRQIICKVNDKSYKGWSYANPMIVYNADLTVYHKPMTVPGSGHNWIVQDLNGDGRDELLMGYSLLDHHLEPIWTLDLGPGFNYSAEHADHIGLSDLNGDGKLEVCYSGTKDFFVTDLAGKILWKSAAGHSQQSLAGPWGPQGEQRIIMAEKNRGLWGLDNRGKTQWHRTDINGYAVAGVHWSREGACQSWAVLRPQMKPIKPIPYQSDPAWSVTLWPRFLSHDGTPLDVFPWKDEYAQPKRLIRAERSYDCGVKYYPLVKDIDHDGLDEVLIHDRDRVWLFHSPE